MKLKEIYETANTGLDAIKRAPILDYETNLRCIRIQDISQSKEYNEWGYTQTTLNDYKKFKLKKNDILVARTGATVGVSYIVNNEYEAVFNNGTIRLRLKDSVNPHFVYYIFQSKEFRQYIENVSCVSTQPNLKVENLLRFDIPEYDKSKQDLIVEILVRYDELIEKNNNRISILEQMAEEIYKEWFIRFRFPGYESAEFENGIPKGWKIKKLKEIAVITYGYSFDSSLFTEEITDTPIVRIRDIPNGITKTYTTEKCEKKYLISCNDIIVGMDGIFHMNIWKEENTFLNQRNLKIRASNNISQYFLYLSILPQIKYWEQVISGTTVAHLGERHINRINVLVPDNMVLENYNEVADEIMNEILLLWRKNRNLIKQRDLLLPRLMSGKLEMK